MLDIRFALKTHYGDSHALVIGIDEYVTAAPLAYAVSDAHAIRDILIDRFAFPQQNVVCLTNKQATKNEILKAYMALTSEQIGIDDRILVFFAGHGYTRTGYRGETGFLIPHDANTSDYSTFIRWDDLTRNSEFIRSKHVLFIMDACYGGLALTRHTHPGSARFLKDMLLRYSRQVLTAGKADELVSDGGGPIPNHSVFTGHLLEALQGRAAIEGDIITANSVMAYVYHKVARDKNSHQTPHYGHFDGDGDFIFNAPSLHELEEDTNKDLDRLITFAFPDAADPAERSDAKISRLKQLLSNDDSEIELHDFLVRETKELIAATSEDEFPVSSNFDVSELASRITRYEEASSDFGIYLTYFAHWARPRQFATLQKCLSRICDPIEARSGKASWLELRWYPLIYILYHTGIAAMAARRFDTLAAVFDTRISTSESSNQEKTLIEGIGDSLLEFARLQIFNKVPGYERKYTPISEHLFKVLQPRLDETLFLGKGFEDTFDTFEIFLALTVSHNRIMRGRTPWGPTGRFGWKHRQWQTSQLSRIVSEGLQTGDAWVPLNSGFFGGSYSKFKDTSEKFIQHVEQLSWH